MKRRSWACTMISASLTFWSISFHGRRSERRRSSCFILAFSWSSWAPRSCSSSSMGFPLKTNSFNLGFNNLKIELNWISHMSCLRICKLVWWTYSWTVLRLELTVDLISSSAGVSKTSNHVLPRKSHIQGKIIFMEFVDPDMSLSWIYLSSWCCTPLSRILVATVLAFAPKPWILGTSVSVRFMVSVNIDLYLYVYISNQLQHVLK